LIWNDDDIAIHWGVENPLVSDKDLVAGSFKDFESKF